MIHSLRQKNNQDITREDPRTSTIFDALLHLPDRLVWEVIRDACNGNKILPKDLGTLEAYDFWPEWGAKGTTNECRVEPDVFLRFTGADIIVEAKRFDSGGQNQGQWEKELTAYQNEYGSEKKTAFLIALGGNGNHLQSQTIQSNGHGRTVVKSSWAKLYGVLLEKHKRLAHNERRVVDSLVLACNLFGFRNYEWLDERQWASGYVIDIPDDYLNLVFRSN